MTEIETLLTELLKIPSVTGQEKNIADFILDKIKNLPHEIQNIEPNRFNIVVKKGSSKKWLVAHMDTVPGLFPIKIDEDFIYGRGACDNKQSVAAAIILAQKLENINVIFTVGEEVDFIGARHTQSLHTCADAELVIVQEPTDFKIINGQCGVIAFSVQTQGREQHSSLPNPENAIVKMMNTLTYLQNQQWHGFNIGTIQGGTAENVVAGNSVARISVRPQNKSQFENILAELKQLEDIITINKQIEPYTGKNNGSLNIASHFSEMAFFPNSIQFGAGHISIAHTSDERISRTDLNMLVDKLTQVLETA